MGCWGQGKVEDPRLALRNRILFSLFHCFPLTFGTVRWFPIPSCFLHICLFFLDTKTCVTFFPEGGSELVRLLLFFVFRAGWRITFFSFPFLSFFLTLSAGLFIIVYIKNQKFADGLANFITCTCTYTTEREIRYESKHNQRKAYRVTPTSIHPI